jgi:predicted nucleic acid-binding protein
LANIVLKSGAVLEEQSESLEDTFDTALEKGKDLIEDFKSKTEVVEETKQEVKVAPKSKNEEKSARDRLKDKGLM